MSIQDFELERIVVLDVGWRNYGAVAFKIRHNSLIAVGPKYMHYVLGKARAHLVDVRRHDCRHAR